MDFHFMAKITSISGPRFTNIRKSYEFVTPKVLYRLNEFVGRKSLVRTFVKRTADLLNQNSALKYSS